MFSRKGNRPALLLSVLFFTAASSLVYELVWTRKLSHVFGTSALAESTVLSVFMGGLALGSLLGGQLLERSRNPMRFLALLEFGIAGTCFLTLSAIAGLNSYYLDLLDLSSGVATDLFHVLLYLVASLILIVPTFLIGVAFPTIVQLFHRERERVGPSVGHCYMVDTLGGSLGLLVAAFFLVSRFGFLRVSLLASAVNLALGIAVLVVYGKAYREASPLAPTEGVESSDNGGPGARVHGTRARLIPLLFFFSGFAALCFEVIWIRHVSLIYGASLHAFAIVVVAFLFGLGVGSLSYNLLLRRITDHTRLFASITLAIGLLGVLLTTLLPHLESLFLRIYHATDSYLLFAGTLAAVCIGLIMIPTLLMGATLPVLSAIYASKQHIGRDVGRLFSINSLGGVFGSFCAGFLIIPTFGIDRSSLLAGGIYLCISLAFLLLFGASRRVMQRTAIWFGAMSTLTLGCYVGLGKSNHLYNGAFYLGTVYDYGVAQYASEQRRALRSLRFLKHSPHGQIAVFGDSRDSMVITNNGKIDASSDPSGLVPRYLSAHIPIFLHGSAKDVATIGLGGGWTLSAILLQDVRSADVIEINSAVVEANRKVLYAYNRNSLADSRSTVIVSDGRNYLANTEKRYDIIISEPPEVWVSGVSSLFTREFYQTAKRALRSDGLLSQWLPRYEMSDNDYRMALHTMSQSFPFIYEFDMRRITGLSAFQEMIVVGAQRELDFAELTPEIRARLEEEGGPHRDSLLRMLEMARFTFSRGHREIRADIATTPRLNTDDLPLLEFHTLRNRFRKYRRND